MSYQRSVSNASLVTAFLIGVILFITFGQDWLALESRLVFLAGVTGIGVAVLAFGLASNLRKSRRKQNKTGGLPSW